MPDRGSDKGETIFAPASGVGRAAIAVIRISGPRSADVLRSLCSDALPAPRRAVLRSLHDPATGDLLDEAIVLWLPGPATFTGEDQAELQIHGSMAVRAAILRAMSDIPNCRAAEPGEFTRRAFLSGRLDLTAVEGLADLIDAETEAQRRQALRQLDGHLWRKVESWRERLIDALAACEAALDFADEDDVPDSVAAGAGEAVLAVAREIASALANARHGERVRDGFQVVIAGPPNAGKSTLLNTLARRDVAIVSPIPGTTRDLIEVRCDLGGLPVTFVDTAGLQETEDLVEQEGISRARDRMDRADLVLWLEPADAAGEAVQSPAPGTDAQTLRIMTKADLGPSSTGSGLSISAKTGEGVDRLLEAIEQAATNGLDSSGDAVLTRERHRAVMSSVLECLDRVALAVQGSRAPEVELLAEDIRLALRHLGRLTGAVDVEEVLGRIFASFCIGK